MVVDKDEGIQGDDNVQVNLRVMENSSPARGTRQPSISITSLEDKYDIQTTNRPKQI